VGRTNSAYDDVKGNVLVSTNSSTLDAAGGFLGASGASTPVGATTATTAGSFSLANAQAIANYNKGTGTAASALSAYKNFAKSTGSWVGYAYTRFDNSIKFSTANYGGLTASVGYGFGEDKNSTIGATHNLALNTQYVNGPIGVVVAYQEETLAKTATATSYLKNTLVGGSYDFAVVKLFAAYNEAKFTGLEKQKEFALGVSVPVGAFTLRAEAARSKGDSLGKATGYDLEALYDLSKRTTLYSSYVTSKKEMLVGPNSVTTSILAAGIRHKF
jgi:predicted porin